MYMYNLLALSLTQGLREFSGHLVHIEVEIICSELGFIINTLSCSSHMSDPL